VAPVEYRTFASIEIETPVVTALLRIGNRIFKLRL